MKITYTDEKRHRLLHYIGRSRKKRPKGLENTAGEGDYIMTINAPNGYFGPKLNRVCHVNMLQRIQQKARKSIGNFYVRVNEKVTEMKLEDLEKRTTS